MSADIWEMSADIWERSPLETLRVIPFPWPILPHLREGLALQKEKSVDHLRASQRFWPGGGGSGDSGDAWCLPLP